MPTTYVDYTATAAQTDFAFTFPFLEDEHVIVEIDGSATTAFSIVTTPSTKIVLDSGATAGQKVRVRRKSQPDTDLVDFENGSVLTESELDRAYLHNRYLNEEISELNDASLQKAVGSDDWDAKNQKLTNLADPTEAQDAATKNYVDTQDALQVTKTGDSMSGALAMGSNKITGLGTPTLTDDAATKTYVDAKVNQVSSGASSPPPKYVFTGTAGANTTYSVTGAEVNGDTAYDVSIDGAVQEPTTDFTVDPDTDILTIIPTLSGGEDIVVIERGFGIAVSDGVVGEAQLQDHSVTAIKISNTDPIFNVQTTGEVGIGTTSPIGKLDIREDGDQVFMNLQGSTAGNVRLRMAPQGVSTNASYIEAISAGTNTDLQLNEALYLKYDGNVGIGTTDPSAKLTLPLSESIHFKNSLGDTKAEINSGSAGTLEIQGDFDLRFSTTSEAMRIDSSGNVGIGTTSPSAILTIEGEGSDTPMEGSHLLDIKSTGNSKLADIRLEATDSGGSTRAGGLGFNPDDNVVYLTNNGEQVLNVENSGNVGIGTTSPSAPLDVTSTTGGVVFPRLTTTQRDAISSPTDGETIFNTTTNQVESYNGSSWGATGGAGATLQAKASFQGVTSVTRNTNAESNIASVTRTGSGQYTVTFTSAVTDPVVSMSVARLNGTFRDRDQYLLKDSGGSTVYSGSVASIDIQTADASGVRDAELIQLLVF